MWMRFWKGPGSVWSTHRENLGTETRCDPTTRDEHIVIQSGVFQLLQEAYQKDPSLNRWILNLPVIYYDFQSGQSTIQEQKLDHYLHELFFKEYCQGFGGNRLLQTAYYLINYILDITTNEQFNAFIVEQLPNVLPLEKMIVDRLLTGMNPEDFPDKYRVLIDRQRALNNPTPRLPIFIPKDVGENVHV